MACSIPKCSLIGLLCLLSLQQLPQTEAITSKLRGQTLKVVIIETSPFVFKDDEGKFAGYLIDFWRRIEELLDFQSEIYEVPDKKYGHVNTTSGQWTGMVSGPYNYAL